MVPYSYYHLTSVVLVVVLVMFYLMNVPCHTDSCAALEAEVDRVICLSVNDCSFFWPIVSSS